MTDRHHLLSKYRQDELRTQSLSRVAKAIRETPERVAFKGDHLLPVDPADLRGIPCIARGVAGASPGTRPDTRPLVRAG